MIYLISDSHFNHKNIIDYEERPFDSVEKMNQHMIEQWNKTISNKDTVYHLGDFAWGNKEEVSKILSQLNGSKILIMGNHDRKKSSKWWMDAGFDMAIKGGVILDDFYLLSHEPMHLTPSMPYVNCHGHIHSMKFQGRNHINLCVELWDYKPVLFEKLKERYKED